MMTSLNGNIFRVTGPFCVEAMAVPNGHHVLWKIEICYLIRMIWE